MKYKTPIIAGLAIVVAAVLVYSLIPGNAEEAPAKQPDGAALICNGDVLTFDELNESANTQLQAAIARGMFGMEEDNAEAKQKALEQIRLQIASRSIEKFILTQEAKRRNLAVTDDDFNAELARAEEYAKAQNMTLDEFIASTQIPKEVLFREIRENLLITKLITTLQDAIVIAPDEIAAEQARAAEARKKIEDLKKQIDEGADFAELAKANSDCPSSARGGDLGEFGRGQMVKPFEDAAFTLDIGAVSDIVTTQFGFHIIKVTAKNEEKDAVTASHILIRAESLTDDEIASQLKQAKFQTIGMALIQRLKDEAVVECNIPGFSYDPSHGGLVGDNEDHTGHNHD